MTVKSVFRLYVFIGLWAMLGFGALATAPAFALYSTGHTPATGNLMSNNWSYEYTPGWTVRCASATGTYTNRSGNGIQREQVGGQHINDVWRTFTTCTLNNIRVVFPNEFEGQSHQLPGGASTFRVLDRFAFRVAVNEKEECEVKIPADNNNSELKEDTEVNSGKNIITKMNAGKVFEEGEETSACKTIEANGKKTEGKFGGEVISEQVKLEAPGGGFHAATYPVKIHASSVGSQVFDIGKIGEVACKSVNLYGWEYIVEDQNKTPLLAEYSGCETKVGGVKASSAISVNECVFYFHDEKGATKGTMSLECPAEGSIVIKTGILGCELKIGESGNSSLKGVEYTNLATKPATFELIPHLTEITYTASKACAVAGITSAKDGSYSGASKAEGQNEKGESIGVDIV